MTRIKILTALVAIGVLSISVAAYLANSWKMPEKYAGYAAPRARHA